MGVLYHASALNLFRDYLTQGFLGVRTELFIGRTASSADCSLGRAGMEGGGSGERRNAYFPLFLAFFASPNPPVYACNAGLLIVDTRSLSLMAINMSNIEHKVDSGRVQSRTLFVLLIENDPRNPHAHIRE